MGRVSNAGFGKAVEGFDLIVSGMVNLTPSTGFASGSTAKGTVICILAFEVANTIVKGANLISSLSKENIKYLKEVVFNSDGVQRLVSSDAGELERLVEADKRSGAVNYYHYSFFVFSYDWQIEYCIFWCTLFSSLFFYVPFLSLNFYFSIIMNFLEV